MTSRVLQHGQKQSVDASRRKYRANRVLGRLKSPASTIDKCVPGSSYSGPAQVPPRCSTHEVGVRTLEEMPQGIVRLVHLVMVISDTGSYITLPNPPDMLLGKPPPGSLATISDALTGKPPAMTTACARQGGYSKST